MFRTQIYLTEEERRGLGALSKSTGKKKAQLIREAVDQYIAVSSGSEREFVLARAAGLWKDRDDLPDPKALRAGWDRLA